MTLPHLYYRRIKCNGREHISHWFGAGRIICDNADVLVVDWALPQPELLAVSMGGQIDTPRSRTFNLNVMWQYCRAWWWRSHPLNIMTIYDLDGSLILQSIDFATPATTTSEGIFQTDLYLDCFVAADGRTYLVEDQDELQEAYECGLVSLEQCQTIEHELTLILEQMKGGMWFSWLARFSNHQFNPSGLCEACILEEITSNHLTNS